MLKNKHHMNGLCQKCQRQKTLKKSKKKKRRSKKHIATEVIQTGQEMIDVYSIKITSSGEFQDVEIVERRTYAHIDLKVEEEDKRGRQWYGEE